MTYLFNMPKEVTFEQFYNDYPRKVGRYTAEKCFKKLSIKDRIEAYEGLKNYLVYWKAVETEKQFIPHPSRFINQKRWEDDLAKLEKELLTANKEGTKYINFEQMLEEKGITEGLELFKKMIKDKHHSELMRFEEAWSPRDAGEVVRILPNKDELEVNKDKLEIFKTISDCNAKVKMFVGPREYGIEITITNAVK